MKIEIEQKSNSDKKLGKMVELIKRFKKCYTCDVWV